MKRTTLEVIAPTIEEAIANGLQELGLSEDRVDIEILDEGSRGLFGIGSRQARVRLSVKIEAASKGAQTPGSMLEQAVGLNRIEAQEWVDTEGEAGEEHYEPEQAEQISAGISAADRDYILEVAEDTVTELLRKMKVNAEVSAHHGTDQESRNRYTVRVDIQGRDLSILIGRQAETLNALQYISSLIVGKELGRSIPLVLDVEGYRQRREQQLRQLARRMADQAIKTGRRQVLEPMPANERRLIHIELRDNSRVKTESIGEEPRRKVTIIPI